VGCRHLACLCKSLAFSISSTIIKVIYLFSVVYILAECLAFSSDGTASALVLIRLQHLVHSACFSTVPNDNVKIYHWKRHCQVKSENNNIYLTNAPKSVTNGSILMIKLCISRGTKAIIMLL
jgi:hypothetical protein